MQYWETGGGGTKDATTGSPVEEDVPQLTTETPIEEGTTQSDEKIGNIQGNEEQGHAEETEQVEVTTSPTSEL